MASNPAAPAAGPGKPRLNDRLMLLYTGVQRNAHDVLDEQLARTESGDNEAALIRMAAGSPEQMAKHFEGDWMKMSNDEVGTAYAWALANVECILHSGGMTDLDRIMQRIAAGEAPESATKAITRDDYAALTSDTVDYLRKTYGN